MGDKPADFVDLLRSFLVSEKGRTDEEASALIRRYPAIVSAGIVRGPFALGAIAMALEMKEQEDKESEDVDA